MRNYTAAVFGDTSFDTFLILDEDDARLDCHTKRNFCEICFDLGEKIPVKSIHEAVGGNAANASVGLTRLGIKTALVSEIGKDAAGEFVYNMLKSEKVNLEYISRSENSNRSTVISSEGERTIFSYHEKREYRMPKLPTIAWVYVTSMKDGYAEFFHKLIDFTNRHESRIIFNPGTYQLRHSIVSSQGLLHKTSVLILNLEEAAHWLGRPETTSVAELIHGLSIYGPQSIVITAGHKGSYGFDGINSYFCPAWDSHPVESTGAGDSYASALTAALIHGLSLKEAMVWGSVNAASVITRVGGQAGLLSLSNLRRRLTQSNCPVASPTIS